MLEETEPGEQANGFAGVLFLFRAGDETWFFVASPGDGLKRRGSMLDESA